MSTHKSIDKICVLITILALVVTALFMVSDRFGVVAIVDEDAESYTGDSDSVFTANDLNSSWDTSSATVITLNGTDIDISGNGAYSYDGSVYISNAGTYVISGTLSDGSIVVSAYDSSKVWILLNGVDITCSDNAGILITQADKVFLTLAEGTENSITTGSAYSEEATADNVNGAIYSKDDLTINGSGSLTVNTEYQHGIKVKDDLAITDGTISIEASEDGIHVNRDFYFTGADLTINAGDDGIHADDEIVVAGGSILIETCYEGMEAMTIDIQGGDTVIYPTDDGLNANGGSDSFGMGMMGGRNGFGNESEDSESSSDDTSTDEDETWIHISDGSITVINDSGRDADGLDSNGDIIMTGGTVRVNLLGDGSNSAIDYGSESGGVFEISGGTVVACGGSSMAEGFDESSTQPGILYTLSTTEEAGTEILVLDADGNELLSYTPENSFSAINLSCPEFVVGETYTIVIGDTSEEITLESTSTTAGTGSSGMGGFGGGMMGGNGGMMGGNGGHGGRGGFGQMNGSTESSDFTPPEGTEGGFDRQMPEMDSEFEGGFDGQMPEMDSEFEGNFDGQMPEMNSEFEGGFGGMGGGNPMEQMESEDTTVTDTATPITELDASVWTALIACVLVLAGGLIFVVLYRRRR